MLTLSFTLFDIKILMNLLRGAKLASRKMATMAYGLETGISHLYHSRTCYN